MGTRSRVRARGGIERALTAPMKWALITVGLLVVTGLSAAAWMLTVPADRPSATSGATSSAATPGPLADAPLVAGSEVEPPAATQAPDDRLPQLPTPTPRVVAPLPEGGSAAGALVEGFPADVAGPLADADVITSAIAVAGSVMQATLTARTDATADDVRADYALRWSALGLADAGGEVEGYADPFSSVMLAFAADSGTGTVYTVYAVLHAE